MAFCRMMENGCMGQKNVESHCTKAIGYYVRVSVCLSVCLTAYPDLTLE